MAKYDADLPGNSMGFKFQLTDLDGKPVSDEVNDQFVAGLIKNTRDFLCFYAGNVNSYKRLYEEEYYNTWNKIGTNSDIQGVNLIKEKGVNKINFMLPGADSNPYLALFSIIESGKSGIEQKLSSKKVTQELKGVEIPTSLNKARKIFKNSEAIKNSLGADFQYHYNAIFEYEYQSYNNQVSLWELERYHYSI